MLRFLVQCVVLLSAVFALRSAESADVFPSVTEFDAAQPAERRQIISRWVSMLSAARARNQSWKPDDNWNRVFLRLAAIPGEQSDLLGSAAQLFSVLGEPTEQCLKFCHAVLANPGDTSQIDTVIELLGVVKARDERSRILVLKALTERDSPRALDFLVKAFGTDLEVKAAVIEGIADKDKAKQLRMLRSLTSLKLTNSEAVSCIASIAGLVKRDPGAITHEFAAAFLTCIQNAPQPFHHGMDADNQEAILQFMKPMDNVTVRTMWEVLILTSSKNFPDDLSDVLLKTNFDRTTGANPRIIGALGFLPCRQLNEESRLELLKSAKGHHEEALAGIFSRYWRSGSDFESSLAVWKIALQRLSMCQENYWQWFAGFETLQPVPPNEWRERWEGIIKHAPELGKELCIAIQKNIIQSLEAFPDNENVPWVLEQALPNKDLSRDIERLLWNIRKHGESLGKTQGLKDWLLNGIKTFKATIPRGTLYYAGLLYQIFGDRHVLDVALASFKDEELFNSSRWPFTVDLLLDLDPHDKRLDQFRRMNSAVLNEKAPSGAAWRRWLLDLRQGMNPGEPPLIALATALREEDNDQVSWLKAFVECGEKNFPYLDSLRDPYIFVAGASASSSHLMQFLGALDRLELSRRKQTKK